MSRAPIPAPDFRFRKLGEPDEPSAFHTLAFALTHHSRVTVILAEDLAEAFDKARTAIAMQPAAESVELRLIGPVWDAEHPQFRATKP